MSFIHKLLMWRRPTLYVSDSEFCNLIHQWLDDHPEDRHRFNQLDLKYPKKDYFAISKMILKLHEIKIQYHDSDLFIIISFLNASACIEFKLKYGDFIL